MILFCFDFSSWYALTLVVVDIGLVDLIFEVGNSTLEIVIMAVLKCLVGFEKLSKLHDCVMCFNRALSIWVMIVRC